MSYTEENQPGKGKGFGGKTEQEPATKSYGQTESKDKDSKTQTTTEPWKQKLQQVNLEEEIETKEERGQGGTYGKVKSDKKDRWTEQSKKQGGEATDDDSEEKEGDEGYEEGQPERRGEKRPNKIGDAAKKAMEYINERTENVDKGQLAKYAAVGVLLLAGMRKSSFLGSIAMTIAAGVITKYIAENAMSMIEEAGEEEEEETATA